MGLINLIFQKKITPPEPPTRKDGFYALSFEGRDWLVKPGVARFYCRDVILEDLNNHNFGTYSITCRYWEGSRTADYRVTYGKAHPHILHGKICFGNVHNLAHQFLGRGDAEGFAGVVDQVIRIYNPDSPFEGWWRERWQCRDCRQNFYGRADTHCAVGRQPLCGMCAIPCKKRAGIFLCKDHRLPECRGCEEDCEKANPSIDWPTGETQYARPTPTTGGEVAWTPIGNWDEAVLRATGNQFTSGSGPGESRFVPHGRAIDISEEYNSASLRAGREGRPELVPGNRRFRVTWEDNAGTQITSLFEDCEFELDRIRCRQGTRTVILDVPRGSPIRPPRAEEDSLPF